MEDAAARPGPAYGRAAGHIPAGCALAQSTVNWLARVIVEGTQPDTQSLIHRRRARERWMPFSRLPEIQHAGFERKTMQ